MPAESTNLIATGARIEAQVVDLEGLHAEWAFGQVITAGIHDVHDELHSKMFSIKNTKHTLVVQLFFSMKNSGCFLCLLTVFRRLERRI